ncbi:hypothetical protein F4809DRAFT_595637 [Biscogniauxia mediterranea]|nr:hypothetical protein F4809DRAFT_595637 [Biscogniauxia mediterranea]
MSLPSFLLSFFLFSTHFAAAPLLFLPFISTAVARERELEGKLPYRLIQFARAFFSMTDPLLPPYRLFILFLSSYFLSIPTAERHIDRSFSGIY